MAGLAYQAGPALGPHHPAACQPFLTPPTPPCCCILPPMKTFREPKVIILILKSFHFPAQNFQKRMTASNSEDFCLQWNDFVKNVTSSVSELRTNAEFADVTLACGDGQKIRGHKIILSSGSHTFKALLKQNSDPNVLIFMRGVKSYFLKLIVDFIYFGEISVHQDNLNEFLALAEDLNMRGLNESAAPEEPKILEEHKKRIGNPTRTFTKYAEKQESATFDMRPGREDEQSTLSLIKKTGRSGVSFKDSNGAIDIQINALMRKVEGINTGWECITCGKIDRQKINIKKHIEGHHIERVEHYCNFCGQSFSLRSTLQMHISRKHTYLALATEPEF